MIKARSIELACAFCIGALNADALAQATGEADPARGPARTGWRRRPRRAAHGTKDNEPLGQSVIVETDRWLHYYRHRARRALTARRFTHSSWRRQPRDQSEPVHASVDPVKDFSGVCFFCDLADMLTLHPSVPAKNDERADRNRQANPGKLNFGSSGTASSCTSPVSFSI